MNTQGDIIMEKFEEWAIIDLFGHQKIAGRISEQQIGGSSFVHVADALIVEA